MLKKFILSALLAISPTANNTMPDSLYLAMTKNEFPAGRNEGLQVFEVMNFTDSLVVFEIQCSNTVPGSQLEGPNGISTLEPKTKVDFGVLIDATKVDSKRPVAPQCILKRWVKWT